VGRTIRRFKMNREEQEYIFIEEVQKTLGRLASEFDLSTFFVVGALEIILLDLKADLLDELNDDEEEEDEDDEWSRSLDTCCNRCCNNLS
jgi:hypothetical protein